MEPQWLAHLQAEFESDYMRDLRAFLIEEKAKYKIYPPGNEIFSAFWHAPFDEVKVVIIGQDPYHGPGQAHGLCFSVNKGLKHHLLCSTFIKSGSLILISPSPITAT